ncbi:MAG TPA: phosphatidylserine decarboxylase [Stellaceae bacterium]|nr:phosphatidylserine decarboxylase [Stellaceae bacterium]
MLRNVLAPIHPDGWRFIAIAAAVTLLLFWLAEPLGWIGVVLTLWCAYFFRDPWRVTPTRAGLVIAPADGVVVSIGPAKPPQDLGMDEMPMTRIGIFLNVFDVHVNRMPMAGRVLKLAYHAGKFFNASLDKASEQNERMAIRLAATEGADIAVVQIAGLVARRIVCTLTEGQEVMAGQRFGLIRFGSRTDVYVPASWTPFAVTGQRVIGGETVIADSRAQEPARQGIEH